MYKGTEWNENGSLIAAEPYITDGFIRWDGWTAINFVGSLHLYGKHDFESHAKIVLNIFSCAKKLIPNFNEELAS